MDLGLIAVKTRKQVVLAAMLVTMLGSALAFGEDRDPCYEAYRQSGLTHQQMSFEEFRELYGVTVCAPSSDGLVGNAPGAASRSLKESR
jgi:hypothetical protein